MTTFSLSLFIVPVYQTLLQSLHVPIRNVNLYALAVDS